MGVESGVATNGLHSSISLEAGVTPLDVVGLGLDVCVLKRRLDTDTGKENRLFLLADLNALSPLRVCNFLGDANLFPRLSEGTCVTSLLGKWRLQTR
jgi:hypothetical protein